jgi:hypothetical protein
MRIRKRRAWSEVSDSVIVLEVLCIVTIENFLVILLLRCTGLSPLEEQC